MWWKTFNLYIVFLCDAVSNFSLSSIFDQRTLVISLSARPICLLHQFVLRVVYVILPHNSCQSNCRVFIFVFFFLLFLPRLFSHFASHYFSFALDYEREEQMCKKCSLAPEATARLLESLTSINPVVTPGRAYQEDFFFLNKNLGRVDVRTDGTLSLWFGFISHNPSGDESNDKCHLGHLGGDWMRSCLSR